MCEDVELEVTLEPARYEILAEGRAIWCRRCGRTSWNPNDVKFRYCGWCHRWHERL